MTIITPRAAAEGIDRPPALATVVGHLRIVEVEEIRSVRYAAMPHSFDWTGGEGGTPTIDLGIMSANGQ